MIAKKLLEYQNFNEKSFAAAVEIEFSMIDGKVVNALVRNPATLRCPICLMTSKDYKNIRPNTFDHSKTNAETLKLALSSLHSQFKLFEFLIEIHRRQEKTKLLQKNVNITKSELKTEMEKSKDVYRKKIWNLMKSKIDYVKPGFGSSNTGPNVKRCLENPELLSQILEIDAEFIRNICRLSNFFKSKKKPTKEEWYDVVQKIYDTYESNYINFMNLPPSNHKILIHGFDIINSFEKGPFFYSEEAQEAVNEKLRSIRLNHSRKNSFKNMTYDIASYFYISTDPLVIYSNIY